PRRDRRRRRLCFSALADSVAADPARADRADGQRRDPRRRGRIPADRANAGAAARQSLSPCGLGSIAMKSKRWGRIAAAILLTSGVTIASAQVATDKPPLVANAAKVRVDAITVHSPSLEGNLEGNSADREVYVVLPPSYDREPTRRYPVVYALHGYFIGAKQWMGEIHMPQTAEGAFAKGTPEMIVVLPDSKTRHLGSLYASGSTVGDFENFIATDLIAYIDSHYRTLATPASRGLVGHSMGGYGATRIGIKHADKFGALYVMSPGGLTPGGFGGTPNLEAMARFETIKTLEDLNKLEG